MKTILNKFRVRISGFYAVLPLPLLAFMLNSTISNPSYPLPAGSDAGGGLTPPPPVSTMQNLLDLTCVVFGWLFYFLIALTVVFIVIAAYRYLTASGNPEKIKGATNTILYAAIAVAVALLAKSLPLIVGDFLGAISPALLAC